MDNYPILKKLLSNLENCSSKTDLLIDIDKKFLLNEISSFSQDYRSGLTDSSEICSIFSKEFLCTVMILDDSMKEVKFSPCVSIASINIQKDSTLNRTDYLILFRDFRSNEVFGKPKISKNSVNLLRKLSLFCIQNFGHENIKQLFDYYYPISDSIIGNQKRNYLYDQVFNQSHKILQVPIIEHHESPLSCLALTEAEITAPDEIKLSPESSRPFMNYPKNDSSQLSPPDLQQAHGLIHEEKPHDFFLNSNYEPIRSQYQETKEFKNAQNNYEIIKNPENISSPADSVQYPLNESNIFSSDMIPKPNIPKINPSHMHSNQLGLQTNFSPAFIQKGSENENKLAANLNEKLRNEKQAIPMIPPPSINPSAICELNGKLQDLSVKNGLTPLLKSQNGHEIPKISKELRPPNLLQSSSLGNNEVKPPPLLQKKTSLDTPEILKNSNLLKPSVNAHPFLSPIPQRNPDQLPKPSSVPLLVSGESKFPVALQGSGNLDKSSVAPNTAAQIIRPIPPKKQDINSSLNQLSQNLEHFSNFTDVPVPILVNPLVPIPQNNFILNVAPQLPVPNIKVNDISKSQLMPKSIPQLIQMGPYLGFSQVPIIPNHENMDKAMKPIMVNPNNLNPNKEEYKAPNINDNKEKPIDLSPETKGIKIQPIGKANPLELVARNNMHNIGKESKDPVPFYNRNLDAERLNNQQILQKIDKAPKPKIVDCEDCQKLSDKPFISLECKCKLCEMHLQLICIEKNCCWCDTQISSQKIEEIKNLLGI